MNIVTLESETRDDLAKLFTGFGAEIGTEQGAYAEIIAKYAKKLYCVDAWKPYRGYRDHTREGKLERFFETTVARLSKCPNVWIVRKFSMDAVKDFQDEQLDFVYIDANHSYDSVIEDITQWSKKIKKGGIISGHDYIRRKGQDQYYDVVRAVNDYVRDNNIPELFIYRGDSPASWMFKKP